MKRIEDYPAVLRPDEVAEICRLGRSATYELLRKGVIPSLRLGRKIVVSRQALEELLSGRPAVALMAEGANRE